LMMEAISPAETSVLNEPYGVTSKKTAFLIISAARSLNPTLRELDHLSPVPHASVLPAATVSPF
jgi:hypothetical protein